jgi:osmotically-inducible protein OsmY
LTACLSPRSNHAGETQIASGFESGDTPEQQARGTLADSPSDEALEDLAHRALRLDASTAHLHLRVGVLQGVVRLRGPIEDEADAENALAVAGDVPGVIDVIDELTRPE